MLVTAAVRTWPCVSCLHVSSSELCCTTTSRGLGTRETCRLSPAGRRPRSGGPTAAGLCVHLWTCVGGCPETPWPGWQLPQHPQGKVLRQLRNAAREPGQRVGSGCARAGCTALPRRRGVRAPCPERRLARSTPAPPVGRGLGRPGMLGKAVSPLGTVRFRRVWLRRGRGVNANELVFPGAGARLPRVNQHSDGSAPPPSSRRLLAALPGRRAPWPGLPGCPPCSARRLRLPSPWTGSPRHAPGAQSRFRPRGELARWALPRPFPATALAPSVHPQTVIPAAGHRHAQAGPHSCLGVPWACVGTVLGSDRQAQGVPSTGTCRGQSRAGGWGSSLVQLLTWEKRSL